MAEASATSGVDLAMRVVLPERFVEIAGAILMDLLGPFEEQKILGANDRAGIPAAGRPAPEGAGGPAADLGAQTAALVFYPATAARRAAGRVPTEEEILAALPAAMRRSGRVRLEAYDVPRDWVDGWRDHFPPILIGDVCVRPPWESPRESAEKRSPMQPKGAAAALLGAPRSPTPVDVVINPGLGFGTGLHPTTRGTLRLLQEGCGRCRGPLVDAGTGSGVLAIAAAKLGWRPVIAFDNDPVALQSARENVKANGVERTVTLRDVDVAGAPLDWFTGATVLANMTLEPVTTLVRKLATLHTAAPGDASAAAWPRRLVVSGILVGEQERALLFAARGCGFALGLRKLEEEWVSLELLPISLPGE